MPISRPSQSSLFISISPTPNGAMPMSLSNRRISLLHLKHEADPTWEYSSNLAGVNLNVLDEIARPVPISKTLVSVKVPSVARYCN